MKLEQQVTSLELSKRLKELGVKQESHFKWRIVKDRNNLPAEIISGFLCGIKKGNYSKTNPKEEEHLWEEHIISVFTVAELGEMLPDEVTEIRPNGEVFGGEAKSRYIGLDFYKEQINDSYGVARIYRVSVGKKQFTDQSEANARAKMLIYLL